MVGKYVDLSDSYKSLNEALRHAGMKNHARVKIDYVDSETISPQDVARLAKYDAILVPGGFGKRGVEGKIAAARFARENKVPYLGICLGMQVATIEYARNVAGLKDANSTEFDPDTPAPGDRADHRVEGRTTARSRRATRSPTSAAPCAWARRAPTWPPGTLAHSIYGDVVTERHRHRYEANVNYLDALRQRRPGDLGAARQREHLTEIVELPQRRAPLVHGRAVPPRVQVHAVGRPSAVQRLHQGRAGTPGGKREGRMTARLSPRPCKEMAA